MDVVAQLRALEDARKDGVVELADGGRLSVTNLAKVFWPNEADERRPPPLLRESRR